MSDQVHVKGLSDLQKFIDTLPAKMEKNVMRGAVRAGANIIKAEAIATCPVGTARVTAYIRAGGKVKKTGAIVWYAHLIEYTGAVAHIIKAKAGKVLSIGGGLYKSVTHPGMQARPFLRPALDSQATRAVTAAGKYVKQRLETKHGIDTSDVIIGEES
jgi:hypothetical protein